MQSGRAAAWLAGLVSTAGVSGPVPQDSGFADTSSDLQTSSSRAFLFAGQQLASTATSTSPTLYPKNTSGYSIWSYRLSGDWACGFFPGALWLLYESTGDSIYRMWAESWLVELEAQKLNTTTHDVGFMMTPSFGNGYRLTGNQSHAAVMLEAAASLATRFDEDVGCIRSWSWGPWTYPVIIDNVMNLELLFWAAKNGGSAELYGVALEHARTTRENHVRPDGSTYHLVDFEPVSGEVLAKSTWSGVSTESTWSRGQAWAIYGFTMVHRETGDLDMLEVAERAADWFIEHLPADGVPFWDFDAPSIPDTERDTSAAAIAAAGLLELSVLAGRSSRRIAYYRTAERILTSLATPVVDQGYLAIGSQGDPLSPGILMHGCGGHPSSFSGAGVPDESLIWGDYYFIEALLRLQTTPPPPIRKRTRLSAPR